MPPPIRPLSAALLAAGVVAACGGLRPSPATAADAVASPGKTPDGFTALFNGVDLMGWQGHVTMKERATKKPEEIEKLKADRTKIATEHWKVENGAIKCDGKGGVSLQSVKDYGNFELMVDWKIEKKGDSGIYLRGQPQVQIWDSENIDPVKFKADYQKGSGGLWNNPPDAPGKVPLKKADKPVGEWNTFHIKVVGDEVTITLNGELVIDKGKLVNHWEKGKPVPSHGPVELQFHGDPLWFRNVYIKELP